MDAPCKHHQDFSNEIILNKNFRQEGLWWRAVIVGVVITLVGTAFNEKGVNAEMRKQVSVNTCRLDRIEGILDKMATYLAHEANK
jgi:hypothetical protein